MRNKKDIPKFRKLTDVLFSSVILYLFPAFLILSISAVSAQHETGYSRQAGFPDLFW